METTYHLDDIFDIIGSLKSSTEHGKLQWDCDYMPPHFYYIDKTELDEILFGEKEDRTPTLQHGGEFTVVLGQKIYELSFLEGFEIENKTNRYTSLDLKICNLNGTILTTYEEIIENGQPDEHGIEAFCHALFSSAEQWFKPSMFDYKDDEHYLFNHNDVTDDFKNQPLTKLAWKLSQEKRVGDFHRLIIDGEYRKQLLDEIK